MDERLKFVGRLLDGDRMAAVCREFGISRKTGYKIFTRYKDCGLDGLQDQNRRPIRQANRLPFQVERTILQIKREKPTWGAPKIRERLIRRYPGIKTPAKSTVRVPPASAIIGIRSRSWSREVPGREMNAAMSTHATTTTPDGSGARDGLK